MAKQRILVGAVVTAGMVLLFQNCGVGFLSKELRPHLSSSTRAGFEAAVSIQPVKLADPNMIVGAFYFPGWNHDEAVNNQPWSWDLIKPYPEREPLQGWYNDGDASALGAQNARLQIKNATENGINLFIFDWYRRSTPNSPRTVTSLFGAALENGFMKANDPSTGMKFSLLFPMEISTNPDETLTSLVSPSSSAGSSPEKIAEAADQLVNVLYPYWKSTFFDRADYQRISGRPLLFFLGFSGMLQYFGLPAGQAGDPQQILLAISRLRPAIDAMKAAAVVAGDQPPLLGCSTDTFADPASPDPNMIPFHHTYLGWLKAAGCDFHFEYGNSSTLPIGAPTAFHMFEHMRDSTKGNVSLDYINGLAQTQQWADFSNAFAGYATDKNWDFYAQWDSELPSLATISVGWNPQPWGEGQTTFNYNIPPDPIKPEWYTEPTSFYGLVGRYQYKTQQWSNFSRLGNNRLLLLGCWNEFGEGHYIAPTKKFGFRYLEPIRYILGNSSERASYPVNTPTVLYPDN